MGQTVSMAETGIPSARPDLRPAPGGADGAPSRRRRDAGRTRHDILVAAGQRFARHGYSHVTLKEIADDVGVTPALIVRYFGTKRALFEEVAKGSEPALPRLTDGTQPAQLMPWSRAFLAHFDDHTLRVSGVALLRSLDLDDGELFRAEIQRRILRPWAEEITGPDAELRVRLVAGILMGVGMFSLGALFEQDKPPMEDAEIERMARYLAEILAVCVDSSRIGRI